jgi:RimJ/RimL family protein N-acetyltransferase
VDLTGNKVKLLPFNNSDLDLFIQLSMDANIMKHVYDTSTLEEAKTAFYIKATPWQESSNAWLTLSINQIDNNEKLGNIGLKIIDHHNKIAEVGFMLKHSAQGQGFAAEALTLIKDYAFNTLKLNKLTATCSVHNAGSYKLLEKLGFNREQTLLQNTIINGQAINDYVYALNK